MASASLVLVALDVVVDLYRQRITGFDWADAVGMAVTCALLLVALVGLSGRG